MSGWRCSIHDNYLTIGVECKDCKIEQLQRQLAEAQARVRDVMSDVLWNHLDSTVAQECESEILTKLGWTL